jgi:hypothetical protein
MSPRVLLAVFVLLVAPAPALAACPVAPDPSALPDAASLKELNTFVAQLGVRPTGSPAQASYVAWIRSQLADVPGISMGEIPFTINRWSSDNAALRVRAGSRVLTLPIAGPVPYSKPTGRRGVAGALTLVPADQPITAANAAGRVVVRPAPTGAVPNYDFLLPVVSWETYDPHNTIDPLANFYGDFINYNARVADLRAAAAAGARAVLFVKDLPHGQIVDHYEPYEGTVWGVPGLWLGADEGKQITDALAAGGQPSARVVVDARLEQVVTPSVLATVPGQSPQRIVVDSHTDGTNAAEDNGPVAMVAMARYLASLPMACRPRTIQFVFSTAHFFQRVEDPAARDGAAERFARRLDADYDKGTVGGVVVLEHLGAIDYEGVPRADGGPGQVLRPTGLRAIQFAAVTPSPSLVGAVDAVVRGYDMQRTILLQGADAPGPTVPSHCSFGGEGTPYNRHLLPTVGVISAPQSLYDPAIGLEGIDFTVMRSELLGFTELVNRMAAMNQIALAGEVPVERLQRAHGAATCPEAN